VEGCAKGGPLNHSRETQPVCCADRETDPRLDF